MTDPLPMVNSVPESCSGCGKCCEQNGSPVLVYQSYPHHQGPHPFRPEGLPEELIAEIDDHFQGLFRGQEPPGPCLWYDASDQQCKHYEYRPQVCREFELASPACLHARQ